MLLMMRRHSPRGRSWRRRVRDLDSELVLYLKGGDLLSVGSRSRALESFEIVD